tara:strand:+ start:1500 stop:1895 length:396 start_codon:yes stop_codon:yes gene_type:complete
MIKLLPLLSEVSTNPTSYGSDVAEGEPDTGFVQPNQLRILGIDENKPEPWFTKGHYEQLVFPKADYVYGKGKGKDTKSQQMVVVKKIVNTGEKYQDYQEELASWDKYGSQDYSLDYDDSDLEEMIRSVDND